MAYHLGFLRETCAWLSRLWNGEQLSTSPVYPGAKQTHLKCNTRSYRPPFDLHALKYVNDKTCARRSIKIHCNIYNRFLAVVMLLQTKLDERIVNIGFIVKRSVWYWITRRSWTLWYLTGVCREIIWSISFSQNWIISCTRSSKIKTLVTE